MTLPPYTKRHATPAQIVENLLARRLDIPDPAEAARIIEVMGYTRLRIYLESRCDVNTVGRPFRDGTTFQGILRIYECDSKLRAACHEAVGQFEIQFRNCVSETLSSQFGPHPYGNKAIYNSAEQQRRMNEFFENTYENQKHMDGLAKDYSENYSSPSLPPIWYMKEMLTFGEMATFLGSLNPRIKQSIARKFGAPNNGFMRNWVMAFRELRNVCAHHDRLFNRTFHTRLMLLDFDRIRGESRTGKLPTLGVRLDKLAGVLQCLDYATEKRNAPVGIETQIKGILGVYPEIALSEVGYS